jgi:hypothetical protein
MLNEKCWKSNVNKYNLVINGKWVTDGMFSLLLSDRVNYEYTYRVNNTTPTKPRTQFMFSHSLLTHLLHNNSPNQCRLNTHFSPWILPSNSENVPAVYLVDNTSYHRDGTLDSYLFVHTHNVYAGSDCWFVCRIDHTGKCECEQHFEVWMNAADCISFESQLCLQENIPPHFCNKVRLLGSSKVCDKNMSFALNHVRESSAAEDLSLTDVMVCHRVYDYQHYRGWQCIILIEQLNKSVSILQDTVNYSPNNIPPHPRMSS